MFGGVADHSWRRGDFPVVVVAALGTASSHRGQSLLERHACKFYNFIIVCNEICISDDARMI